LQFFVSLNKRASAGKENRMGQFRRLLTAIGLGVGAMYFFDPQLGKARRAKLRDQLNTQLNQTRKDAEA
jgi:hypothetical protein